MSYIDPINTKHTGDNSYYVNGRAITTISDNEMTNTLASNGIFKDTDIDYCNLVNKYGYIDPYNTRTATREYLFFTKPDLYIFDNSDYSSLTLRKELQSYPLFVDAVARDKESICQLQYSAKDKYGYNNPFMYLLTNSVSSNLDLPGINSDSNESTSNIYGTSIQYRSHSMKSDNSYDFNLSFVDTIQTPIYRMVKIYDEYARLLKLGEISPHRDHIINKVLADQFSIYKFLVSEDGETIVYFAKLTGVYFSDVPRGEFGDPDPNGFKYSLSFHAQFVEDSNPMILLDFNKISKYESLSNSPVYRNGKVNNEWARYPYIEKVHKNTDLRAARNGLTYDYRLKWAK